MTLKHQRCENGSCNGYYVVYSSQQRAERQVRYYHCSACGFKPERNKESVALNEVDRRKSKQFTRRPVLTKQTRVGDSQTSGRIGVDVGDFTSTTTKGKTMLQCETERLFVTADELPQLLGLPKREVAFLRLTGQLPQPIELLGGRFVYSVRGVSAWLDDNCPQGNPAAYEQFRERRARAAQAEFTEEAQRQLDKEEAERFAQRIIKAKPGGYVG